MIIYGASGHGKVIASILTDVALYFDDNDALNSFNGSGVERYHAERLENDEIIIAIGDNKIRKNVAHNLNHKVGKAIAASSELDSSVVMEEGCQIIHGAIIQAASRVGKHTIINTGATVDHDCIIEDYCHIAPKSTLCGNVKVGEGTLIGAGAVILPGIKIGKWCVIGAGSVVVSDVPDNATVIGNPGKIITIDET